MVLLYSLWAKDQRQSVQRIFYGENLNRSVRLWFNRICIPQAARQAGDTLVESDMSILSSSLATVRLTCAGRAVLLYFRKPYDHCACRGHQPAPLLMLSAAAAADPSNFAVILQTTFLLDQFRVNVEVVAISNSRKMLLSTAPLQGTAWQDALAADVRDCQRGSTCAHAKFEIEMFQRQQLQTESCWVPWL